MSWARIDDGFPDHPKIAGLSDRAFRTHVTAICLCSRFTTDGEIFSSWFSRISATPRVRKELVEAGVWVENDGKFFVHDFLAYNMSREEIESRRARNAANGRRGGRPKRTESVTQSVLDLETESVSESEPTRKGIPIPIPMPISSGSKDPSDGADAPEKKRITKALREELAAQYPHLNEPREFDKATNHIAYRKAIDKRRYYRNWMLNAEEFRLKREAQQPRSLTSQLPTLEERRARLAREG